MQRLKNKKSSVPTAVINKELQKEMVILIVEVARNVL